MTNHSQLPFFGREAELQLLHDAWRAANEDRKPQIITLVAETGVGKSRIIQEFYRQLTVDALWDPDNFWPDDFQSHATQLRVNLRVNPEFSADYAPDGPPRFLWLGMRWHNAEERNNVVNSLALPTLKEQLIQFAIKIKAMRSRWQRIHDIRTDATLKFFPFVDLITSLITPAFPPHNTDSIPKQLTEIFHTWFAQTDATPIILWLDDAMWIDPEAQAFFAELMHAARNKRWPLLLIATSWPAEWRAFPNDFFLKHETATVYELENATDTELHQLLRAAFSNLPHDQVALILDKAGGNMLTLIEYIAELRNQPLYFVNGDSTQALTASGIEIIRTWESWRQKRIEQRFSSFDRDIKVFLARVSRIGHNTYCLPRALLRCRDIYPDEAQLTALLTRCHASLAVMMPCAVSIFKFRDRGYLAVAQQYFDMWLAVDEAESINKALIAEITALVQSAFDEAGNLRDPQADASSLRAAPMREQYIILELALSLLPVNTPTHVQALALFNEISKNDHL